MSVELYGVSRHDDEGTGVFSLKLGDGVVYGAADRCWVCRGRDVQDYDDDMRDLSRQMVWTESNGQQFGQHSGYRADI